jgi:sensor histidine kinase YesM
VTQHDFIFSNRFSHRLARHISFWTACYFFYVITSYIPGGVFPGYDTSQFAKNISRLGFPTWLWWRFFNSSVAFLNHILFAYLVLYFVLPRFYFDKKNWVHSSILLILLLFLLFGLTYVLGYFMEWNNHRLNPARPIFKPAERIVLILKGQLFNHPIIAGFVVIIKMMKRSWLKQQETEQIVREKSNAELQLLKAQIHPHFLFNTLNNIYFFTLTSPRKAPELLVRLTDILRYIINECKQTMVPLEKEIKLIEDYMTLEQVRYGERLKMEFETKGDFTKNLIAPLLLLPLVENSFKHGTSKMLQKPWVKLTITIEHGVLYFFLSNSRPDEVTNSTHNGQIGLNNVKQRLKLLYPENYELRIAEETESYNVFMKIVLRGNTNVSSENKITKEMLDYAMG